LHPAEPAAERSCRRCPIAPKPVAPIRCTPFQVAQKQILADAFAGYDEWRIPELIDAARRDPELYFDSVSQIDMASWHSGRGVIDARNRRSRAALTPTPVV
jgi:hypothetical protein